MTEWAWIERYALQFRACEVEAGDVAVVLSESRSRPEVVETARLALATLGAAAVDVILPTPVNAGPVPIRSTGASQAIAGHRAAIAALSTADFVADCTVEGLLHAPELGRILAGGARVLMISNEHPENVERWPHDPGLAPRVSAGVARLKAASVMEVTSVAGTELVIDLTGAVRAGSHGWCTRPGSIAHWPGGLVLAFPAAGTVSGTLVLAPGDVNLTFKEYLRAPVRLTIVDDFITVIGGDAVEADLFRTYLASFDEPEAYAVSHVGWGMNTSARWEAMALWDKADHNGTELRAFAGNFLYSTGANEVAGRYCRGHFDLPMRGCTVTLDGAPVVVAGKLIDELAADAPPGADTHPDRFGRAAATIRSLAYGALRGTTRPCSDTAMYWFPYRGGSSQLRHDGRGRWTQHAGCSVAALHDVAGFDYAITTQIRRRLCGWARDLSSGRAIGHGQ